MENLKRIILILFLVSCGIDTMKAQTPRVMRYFPDGQDIVCLNGHNRYTRALYGGHTLFRLETSDRPVFATFDKQNSRNISLSLILPDGTVYPLDSTSFCIARYQGGLRTYLIKDKSWPEEASLSVDVLCTYDKEAVIWRFAASGFPKETRLKAMSCLIADTKMSRNGDMGPDPREKFEADPLKRDLNVREWILKPETYLYYENVDILKSLNEEEGRNCYERTENERLQIMSQIQFSTPDPFINTLGSVLMAAADGIWDEKCWLHGAIGWRSQLTGWRAAYIGDVVGWNDRARTHFQNYAQSMVTEVPPVIPHPTQDPDKGMARALKKWGTQMYSNGYVCRSPADKSKMHHYDMNLCFIDELLWHLQFESDTTELKRFWPIIKSHLQWEKRNFDPDGDHLYDAYCCIWASDALYYNSGAVTHSSAYNYRGNLMAARIAEIIGEDPHPYRMEAEQILQAMNSRLWMEKEGHWAEFQDFMGLKRLHTRAALWSIYTPVDCGACSPSQAWRAMQYIDRYIPHIPVLFEPDKATLSALGMNEKSNLFMSDDYFTLSTTDWMPYAWSTNNVAHAEVTAMAMAFMQAGRKETGFKLLKSDILDEMFLGASPGNFGQISFYDAMLPEAYRDFGDNVGVTARALVQGLFGILPDALNGRWIIQPALPEEWTEASVKTPYLSYSYKRVGNLDVYDIVRHADKSLPVCLRIHCGNGVWKEVWGDDSRHQVISVEHQPVHEDIIDHRMRCIQDSDEAYMEKMGLTDISTGMEKKQTQIPLQRFMNAKVSDVFENQYLSPRSPFTALQIPIHGMGDWCTPALKAGIDESGLRNTIVEDGLFDTKKGVRFLIPKVGNDVIFTSLWDNYPDSVSLNLDGNARYAYLLMAGTTNNMQSRIDNGWVVVKYRDGTADTLRLVNPDNWCPIEQDYFTDERAFHATALRPYRVHLGSGLTSRQLMKDLKTPEATQNIHASDIIERRNDDPRNVGIPQGAAQILKMPLNKHKKLKSMTIRTLSNDVVIGLMAVTLER